MIILALVLICILVWFLAVGWLHWYFIARYKVKDCFTIGSYWVVGCQPFYGHIVQILELSNKNYPEGVLVIGVSQDTHKVITVWLNKEKLLPLNKLQGHI